MISKSVQGLIDSAAQAIQALKSTQGDVAQRAFFTEQLDKATRDLAAAKQLSDSYAEQISGLNATVAELSKNQKTSPIPAIAISLATGFVVAKVAK